MSERSLVEHLARLVGRQSPPVDRCITFDFQLENELRSFSLCDSANAKCELDSNSFSSSVGENDTPGSTTPSDNNCNNFSL